MDTTKFVDFCKTLDGKIRYRDPGPPQVPFRDPFNASALAAIINNNAALLPNNYQQGYAAPLATHLPQLVAALQQDPDIQRLTPEVRNKVAAHFFEPLIGAVFDQSVPEVRQQLRRFLAVISDLYRSFLSKEQRANVSLPLIEQLPPLATFGSQTPDVEPDGNPDGPFTIPSDDTQKEFQSPIGVVSLPSAIRDHPLIWVALAHETGGHDVLHADPGLLPELRRGVARALSNRTLGTLWAFWMDEAASDVYGLLNIGPLFVFNLAAFFTSLVHQLSGGRTPLGVLSNRTFLDENNQPDVHPTDLLRVSLALGVIESLHGLSVTRRSAYVQAVTQLLEVCTGGAQDIEIVAVRPGGQLQVVQTLPLDQMQEAAHQAGAFIANSVLKALGGHSIQEIETWDDEDENKLQEIVTALTAGQPIAGQGDDAQILAAATFALLQAPNQYDQVTALVNTALDASFASDPIFGRPRRQRVLFRPELARRINVERPVSPPSLLALRFALTRAASSAAAKRGDA